MPNKVMAFTGCGVRLAAYAGVVKELESLLSEPLTIIGTSGGGIIGAMIAIGASPDHILGLVRKLDFLRAITDGRTPVIAAFSELFSGDLYNAGSLQKIISETIGEVTGNPDLTLGELYQKAAAQEVSNDGYHYHEFVSFATNLSVEPNMLHVFDGSPANSDVKIADIAMATACFPLFIKPHTFDVEVDSQKHSCAFADGGLEMNDGATWYLNQQGHSDAAYENLINVTIGNLKDVSATKYKHYKHSLVNAAIKTIEGLEYGALTVPVRDPKLQAQTIFVPSLGISTMELKITPKQKEALINGGQAKAKQFKETHPALFPAFAGLTTFATPITVDKTNAERAKEPTVHRAEKASSCVLL